MKFLISLKYVLYSFFLLNSIYSFSQNTTFWESPTFNIKIGIEKTKDGILVDYYKRDTKVKLFKRMKANHFLSNEKHRIIFKSENQLELRTESGDRIIFFRLKNEHVNQKFRVIKRYPDRQPSFKTFNLKLMSQELPTFLAREIDEVIFIEIEQDYLFVYRAGFAPIQYNREQESSNIFFNGAGNFIRLMDDGDFQWINHSTNDKINLQRQ